MRVRRKELLIFAVPLVMALVAAYAQWAVAGLPAIPHPDVPLAEVTAPPGFPAWLRVAARARTILPHDGSRPRQAGGTLIDSLGNAICKPATESPILASRLSAAF